MSYQAENLDDIHIAEVKAILEQRCVERSCVKRLDVFEELKVRLPEMKMEPYRFEKQISEALKDGRIEGYTTRPGKNGGICKDDAFGRKEFITIGNKSFEAPRINIEYLIERILGGKEDEAGNVRFRDKSYTLPKTIHAERLLEALIGFLKK